MEGYVGTQRFALTHTRMCVCEWVGGWEGVSFLRFECVLRVLCVCVCV